MASIFALLAIILLQIIRISTLGLPFCINLCLFQNDQSWNNIVTTSVKIQVTIFGQKIPKITLVDSIRSESESSHAQVCSRKFHFLHSRLSNCNSAGQTVKKADF